MRTQQTNSTANQTACGSELHNSMSGLITAAFFAEGLHDAGYDEVIQSWGRGCIELIDALVRYAPVADSLCQGKDIFPGVYDYEVSAPFGKWFGEYIIEHGDQPPQKEAINWLSRETEAFFAQGVTA